MKILPTSLFANAVLVVSVALLVAVGVWYLEADGSQQPETTLHLTQATLLTSDSPAQTAPPAVVDSKTLPGVWQPVSLPHALPFPVPQQTGAADRVQTDWYRLPIPALPGHDPSRVLYGVRIKTEGTIAVYANGRLVHRAQEHGPLWNSLFTPLWVPLDGVPDNAPLNEILIRLQHPPHTREAISSFWLGPADALRARYYLQQWLQRELPATLNAAFLAVGIFALFVWFRRNHERRYLLFFHLAAVSFAGHLHYYVGLPITGGWFAWLTSNALFWLLMVIHLFMRQLHGRPLTWLTRAVVGIPVAVSVLSMPVVGVLPVYPSTSLLVPLIYGIAVVIGVAVSVAGAVSSWRRSADGLAVAVGLSVCTLLGMSEWLLYNNVISVEGWFLGAYANAVTFSLFSLLMYRRYIGAIVEVEQVNASLAYRLQARETELEESHRKLREAELRQTISDERQRLMQDMHDGLGSSLISAIRSVEGGGEDNLKVSQILKNCLDDLKLTIDSMEPVEADLLLLLATLRFRLEPRLDSSGITLFWEVKKLPPLVWLDPSSALHILRIVQESIANILHHTRASEIRVGTVAETDGVRVVIEDNGRGFDVEHTLRTGKGHGLRNQQRRAQALDGAVDWASGPEGTRFTLWLPLVRAA